MAGRVRDSLMVGRVVGDVLDPFVRTTNLRVSFGNSTVSNGCELKPSMVMHQPRVEVGDVLHTRTSSYAILINHSMKIILIHLHH